MLRKSQLLTLIVCLFFVNIQAADERIKVDSAVLETPSLWGGSPSITDVTEKLGKHCNDASVCGLVPRYNFTCFYTRLLSKLA